MDPRDESIYRGEWPAEPAPGEAPPKPGNSYYWDARAWYARYGEPAPDTDRLAQLETRVAALEAASQQPQRKGEP